MAEMPTNAPPDDEPNPYAPPQADFNDRSGIVDPEVERFVARTSRTNLI